MTDVREDERFRRVADGMTSQLADDSTGHDMAHAWRVLATGVRIAEAEGADTEVVGAAALTHDLHRVRADGGFVHPRETLDEVDAILTRADVPAGKTEAVLHCVAVHEEYDFEDDPLAAETIEAEVLQDADNLDAIGAIGVARTFAFGGAHGRPLWEPAVDDAPVETYEKLGGADPASSLRHIREKALRLAETMNTATGRRLADERHAYMEEFVDRFEREWRGEI